MKRIILIIIILFNSIITFAQESLIKKGLIFYNKSYINVIEFNNFLNYFDMTIDDIIFIYNIKGNQVINNNQNCFIFIKDLNNDIETMHLLELNIFDNNLKEGYTNITNYIYK